MNKELLTKKFLMVGMDEIKISSDEYPIIGTEALGPCISFILYNKEYKKAIVGHLSLNMFLKNENIYNIIYCIDSLIVENDLLNKDFILYLIPGSIPSEHVIYSHELDILNNSVINKYKTIEVLDELFKNINSFQISDIKKELSEDLFQVVNLDGNITDIINPESSKQYAFDSRTGEFVTNNVLFGYEYFELHNKLKEL